MGVHSKYVASLPGVDGFIHYSHDEHARWQLLMDRQLPILTKYAAPVYLDALKRLDLPRKHIPQCDEVSSRLQDVTGWSIIPVAALIDFSCFFEMLSQRQFPAASFIRSRDELDYLQEPDIFHEILGHAPLLLNESYAEFVQAYGKAGCRASKQDQIWLARLFWFTIEFGLLRSQGSVKAFGAGIVSSRSELPYSIEDTTVERRPFEINEVLNTPYRIDILQPVYFVLDNFEVLFDIVTKDLIRLVQKARKNVLKPATNISWANRQADWRN